MDHTPAPPRTRSFSAPLCTATTSRGKQPCGNCALHGDVVCRHHSERHKRQLELTKLEGVTVPALSTLVRLDMTKPACLKQFRAGLMAHIAKATIDVATAKGMHEMAVAIHRDAHADDGADAFSAEVASLAGILSADTDELPRGARPGETLVAHPRTGGNVATGGEGGGGILARGM